MSEEKINYEDYTLDPNKDVLVPISVYVALTNVVNAVEKEHSKKVCSDVYSFFNRKTNEKLSAKSKSKMNTEKLHKEYYENLDLDATAKNIRVDRDELGSAAIRLMAEFRGIFKHNIDSGNRVLRPTNDAPQGPVLVKDVENTENDSQEGV